MRAWSVLSLVPILLLLSRCGSDDGGGGGKKKQDAGADAGADVSDAGNDGADAADASEAGQDLPNSFARYCVGKSWRDTFSAATLGASSGEYVGVLTADFGEGIQEATKIIPEHPFAAKNIRVGFGKGSGKVRLRLMRTFGHSYPASFAQSDWPDYSDLIDLVPPIELDVTSSGKDTWLDVPIPETLLIPTEPVMLVYEHIGIEPRLAVEKVATGDMSRSLVFDPSQPGNPPTGFDGNYRLRLEGDHFCEWTDAERWFARDDKAFGDTVAGWAAWADVNGDGHDDAVFTTSTGPLVQLGDGKGAFSTLPGVFAPDTPKANFFVFGDLDNDGDLDAFASQYVQTDGDGDGVGVDKDCNDGDPAVKPGAPEVPNGYDDDCDGKADDGTDTSDADKDGVSIAAGDCDDTHADTKPGAPELLDGRDNDCDGKTDEDFVPKLLSNDGSGKLTWSPSPDVEILGPSSAAALGDGNGDGLLDLYAGYWLVHYPDSPTVPSRYYEGQAGVKMLDAATKAGISITPWRPVYGVLWTDWNNDSLLDVYVSNYQLNENLLWKNLGGGKFDEIAVTVNAAADDVPMFGYTGGHSFGSDAGDIDNDGDMDLYVPNISHPRVQPGSDPSMLLVNGGAPNYVFANQRREYGLAYDEGDVESSFADFDNDGDLDLLVISTYPSHYPRLYRNDFPDKHFTDVTYEADTHLHQAQTGIWADVDEDGDLDLLLLSPGPGPRLLLMKNRGVPGTHFLELDLRGTTSNRSAIGARVSVTSGAVTRIRELQSQARHPGSHWVHFGLGAGASIDKLEVRWPNGTTETITGASADKRWRIVEGSGVAVAP
ncbi:MAG: VCBS repeat-containing protein [Myxococcales bacterium]|nr:VCBS repeat-containing protein [Myxococcales bacterium]